MRHIPHLHMRNCKKFNYVQNIIGVSYNGVGVVSLDLAKGKNTAALKQVKF